MSGFYEKTLRFLIRHRFIYLGLLLMVFLVLGMHAATVRFDMSDTLWLSAGEVGEASSQRDLTLLAFTVKNNFDSVDVTGDVISAVGEITGVSRVADGRIISGIAAKIDSTTGIVTFHLDASSDITLTGFRRELSSRMSAIEGVADYQYIGQSLLQAELIQFTRKDLIKLLPVVFILSFALLLLLYRNPFVSSLPVINILLTLIGASGVYGIIGLPFTATATIFPALIMVLCMNDSIYIMNAIIRGEGQLQKILLPCLQTGLGLVIGFGALMFSTYMPVRYLGIIGIIAVFFSLFTGLYVLPVIFSCITSDIKRRTEWISRGFWRRLYEKLSAQPRMYGIVLAMLTLIMTIAAAGLRVAADAREYFRTPNSLTRSLEYFLEQGLPVDRVSLYISPPAGMSIHPDDFRAFLQRLKERPKVCGTLSKSDFDRLNLFAEGSLLDMTYVSHLAQAYETDRSGRIRIDIFEQFTATDDIERFVQEFDEWFGAYLKRGYSREFRGGAYFSWQLESRHAHSQIWGFVFSTSLITLLLLLLFGLKRGFLAAVENCWPILSTLALVSALGISFNFVTVMIANIVIGLSVEDTLYLLNRYRHHRKTGFPPDDSFSQAAADVGNSSVFSSVIMAAGFSLLLFSGFTPTFQLGFMATFAIMIALIADLIILPLLLFLYDKR